MSAVESVVPVSEAPPQAPKAKRQRNHTIDLMRVLLFSCVVTTHTVGAINMAPDVIRQMGLMTLLFHYTRYGFVAITVFVLFFGYYRKDTKATTFWRRRFGLVVLPYLVWSVLYSAWSVLALRPADAPPPDWGSVAKETVLDIFQGDAKYQLYFLLISMQIYFFFPLLRWIVRKTEGHHGKLFAAALVVQVAMMFWIKGIPEVSWLDGAAYDPGGLLDHVHYHAWKLLPTYALLVAMGALAAVHFDRMHTWLVGRSRRLIPLIVLAAAAPLVFYWSRTTPGSGVPPQYAAGAVEPTLIPWLVASMVLLYLISAKWNARRGDGSGIVAKAVDLGSIRAFGVYATHPLIIDSLLLLGMDDWLFAHVDGFPGAVIVRSLLLLAATFVCCLVLVEILLRTPLAKALVARDRLPLRKPKPVQRPVVGDAA